MKNWLPLILLVLPVSLQAQGIVNCLGDITGDGIAEIAVLRSNEVQVNSLNGDKVSKFRFDANVIDAEVIADINGNGVPELAVLYEAKRSLARNGIVKTNAVRDALTGEWLNGINKYNSPGLGVDLEQMPDLDGNGVPELVSLYLDESRDWLAGRPRYKVVDALSLETAGGGFDRVHQQPVDLELYPDLNNDGVQDIGVLSQDTKGRRNRISVTSYDDSNFSGALWTLNLSAGWNVLAHKLVRDINNDGYPEVAILREENVADSPRAHVAMFGVSPEKAKLGWIPINSEFRPTQLLTIDDINGNGSDEVVVVAVSRRVDGVLTNRYWRIFIKDSATFQLLNTVHLSEKGKILDVGVCPDLSGNGSQELAVLFLRSTNNPKVWVVDSKVAGGQVGKYIGAVKFLPIGLD